MSKQNLKSLYFVKESEGTVEIIGQVYDYLGDNYFVLNIFNSKLKPAYKLIQHIKLLTACYLHSEFDSIMKIAKTFDLGVYNVD